MSIIGWIIIGAVAGWLASMIVGSNARMGWLGNIIVGIVGALIGGFVWGVISGTEFIATFSLGTLLVAIVGAAILLAIVNAVSRAS